MTDLLMKSLMQIAYQEISNTFINRATTSFKCLETLCIIKIVLCTLKFGNLSDVIEEVLL